MANPSLAEYLAQSQRGMYASVFGNDMLQKGDVGGFTVDTATGIFNTTYGRKVWQALNNQTRFFNAIPRVVWGNTAGWRVRSDRGANRSAPVSESGGLPTVDVSNIETISSLPRIVSTTFGASVKSVFTAQMEGGIGDVLAMENEHAQLDHVKEINEEGLAGSCYLLSGGGASSFTVPIAIAKHFKIGDTVVHYDKSAVSAAGLWDAGSAGANTRVVSSISGGTVTVSLAFNEAPIDGDGIAIYARAGFTSIDDIVAEDLQNFGNVGAGDTDAVFGAGGVRAYDLTFGGRTAGDWNAGASVSYNAGTGRDLSLTLLDTAIQKVRENGGEPKLILMGHDQYFKLERLLNSNQRYMGQEEYQVGVGSERTFPGTRTGLILATYMGIPILPDADVPKSVATNDAVLGSNIYVLDTDYLEMAIAQPTQYIENRDYFAANQLVVRGLLYTMGELRCKNMWVQAKIADLNS